MVNKLETAFERLRAEGWYCAWGLPCCQSCAWGEIPDAHEEGQFMDEEIDIDKVLFNHEQDIEEEEDWIDDLMEYEDDDETVWDQHFHTIESTNESLFCFSGSAKGVKNLIEVLPIFEECGVKVNWNQKGNSRIELEW
jgi:hypothetical protein